RPGGRLLVVDTDWDSIVWHSSSPERMTRVLDAWTEHLVDPHLPRSLAPRLERVGFRLERCQVIPLLNTQCDPNTYSCGLMELVARFVVGRRGVTESEAAAWREDLKSMGESGSYFFSLNRYLFLAAKPDGAQGGPRREAEPTETACWGLEGLPTHIGGAPEPPGAGPDAPGGAAPGRGGEDTAPRAAAA